MRIVPAPDRLVRDPETHRPLGVDGHEVDPADLYWARLLADGDVVPDPAGVPASPDQEPAT